MVEAREGGEVETSAGLHFRKVDLIASTL